MKKKTLWLACGLAIIAALAFMVVFIVSGDKFIESESEPVNLQGTWKVVSQANNETVNLIQSEYMVFSSDSVTDFRNGTEFVSSSYFVDSEMRLILDDISRSFVIDVVTSNYICLYENQETYIQIIRYPNANMSPIVFDTELIKGQWNIAYRRTDSSYAGDYLLFEDGTVARYSASANGIVDEASYHWEDGNHLIVESWGKDMAAYLLSDEVLLLVEQTADIGFIWELHKEA